MTVIDGITSFHRLPDAMAPMVARHRPVLESLILESCVAFVGSASWFGAVGGPMCAACWPRERPRNRTPIPTNALPGVLRRLAGHLVTAHRKTAIGRARRLEYVRADAPEVETPFWTARGQGFRRPRIVCGKTILAGEPT